MSQPIYLVTGAQGFIGAWVVKRLVTDNNPVIILDQSRDRNRLRMIMDDEIDRAGFIEGDITDFDLLTRVIDKEKVTRIIHLAGLQVPTCRADPRLGATVNVIGTLNVFEAAKNSAGQVERIAYASSAAVFGATGDGHAVAEYEAGWMTTHYGAFKRCNEDNARVFYLDHGIRSVGLRPLTVYGVGRDTGLTSDPTKAMKAAVVGRPFHIRFGGMTDLLYVADCAEAFIKAASCDLDGAHVFNLHGETAAITDIVYEIEREFPAAKGMITRHDTPIPMPSNLDGNAIEQMLGIKPATTLRSGVEETIRIFSTLRDEGRLTITDLDV